MKPRGIIRQKLLHCRFGRGAGLGGPRVGCDLGRARRLLGLLGECLIGRDFGTGNEGGGMRFGRYEGGASSAGGSIRTTRCGAPPSDARKE